MEAADDRGVWRVWADTGGTFTDCVALAPDGSVHRAKVLSSASLRGVASARVGPTTLRVRPLWSGPADLVDGFTFRRLDEPLPTAVVAGFEPGAGLLHLDRPVADVGASSTFELVSPDEAPVLAARILTNAGSRDPLPPVRMRLATTRGTNALLERKGARVAFFVTEGFGDVLRIGTQQRPDLFSLAITRPAPLHDTVIEIRERIGADGAVIRPPDEEAIRREAVAVLERGIDCAAVCLVNAYRNDRHERRVGEILADVGFRHVSLSTGIAPAIGHRDRSLTAVVNAYLAPVVGDYVDAVERALPSAAGGAGASLHLMTSAGGLVRSADFRPRDSLLSGPAGGVVGAVMSGRAAGAERIVTFDMGGTSTDVARFDGDYDYVWRHAVGDVELLAPALAIESVAAGGGSVCSYDARGLTVGPESAGARPGPACYGAGGPLTITDCNLLLGRVDPAGFGLPLSVDAARNAIDELLDWIEREEGARPDAERLAAGLVDIANERMADAIRAVSVRRGYDPADYTLVAFGGAGAQHGCGVADRLGIRRIVVPRDASLLSAWGLGSALIERVEERQVLRELPADGAPTWIAELFDDLDRAAVDAVEREGVPASQAAVRRRIVNVRLAGQDATLPLDVVPGTDLAAAFRSAYERTYGHPPEDRAIEIESVRVFASGEETVPELVTSPSTSASPPSSTETRRVRFGDAWLDVPCHLRRSLARDTRISGPCLVVEPHTTVVVEPGWSGRLGPAGAIVLERVGDESPGPAAGRYRRAAHGPDPVRDQIFTARFEGIVAEMGERLRRTALSTNVKERLDFSCALLDARGELVANAPHIPVHLGAIGLCVRSVLRNLAPREGDVFVTNHPGFGGSHLPDLTVITPVFDSGERLLGIVANRAHHAEVGGATPGSMPPTATRLVEEGVVLAPTRIIEGGTARWDRIEALLASGPYPSRAPRDNLADLRAQVAANQRGADLLRALADAAGAALVSEQMTALTARAERGARAALNRLGDGVRSASESLDDGSIIRVEVRVEGDEATFDFAGTDAPHPGNLNATPAIVRSAILYFLRLLIDEPLPLNEGLLRPVRIHLPPSLLSPDFTDATDRLPAVVGGNTEVSQRLVDTLLRALGLAACSQGTMNNLLWGTDAFGYYETIAGGEGATPGHHGCHAVHTHMTNTRITDVEVLERRYPVRVDRFAIRARSGGDGRWRGGDGVVREFTFLAPMTISVLTQHRRSGPFGMAGGRAGAPGRQWLERGTVRTPLDPVDGRDVVAGDRLVIETPGGGGWGPPAGSPAGSS